MKKAIFLDRDGVINEVKTKRVTFVNRPDQFYFLDGALEAIKLLSDSGYLLFIVTNQGGVGLGYLSHAQLQSIHDHMVNEIQRAGGFIQEVSSCTHKPHEGCECRKPEAGMLLNLAEKYDVDFHHSYMIGDREVDIEAGRKAGCLTILLGASSPPSNNADHTFLNLLEAAEFIISNQ
ncbi:HAD family hydrolase (plasmid) [Cytobacillus spongiae]|uniref:D-glycero-alpha-D-manno-heptose-1,7-bisphosphate 7-phosphatase n=1 Tax=Cytobacillus spongiae TaxID=2901381 RepID=UPI00145C3C15|nr:HAD family hydrolase [Cytobacillus spongiae]MCA1062877.1 HAD family hydrolase [Rossellomorea aquimaris]NMH70210.1 HAD family hydrolase [Bacillus sp. RO3]UII58483.1 HAD family hydrolase [Cytobacillus spongiae]WJV28494.1 HAD family hydrolase [Rossellomorea sp. AcN35-11]